MAEPDVYQQWKAQRESIAAPPDFVAKTLLAIESTRLENGGSDQVRYSFKRSAWSVFAVVAASVLGFLRIAFALLFGIS